MSDIDPSIGNEAQVYYEEGKGSPNLKKRVSELEDAMKTFIMRVNKTKSKQELLIAEATAITRFKELLKEDDS